MKKINQCRECKYCKPLTRIGKGTGDVCRCMNPNKTGFNFTRLFFYSCFRFEKGKFNPAEFESGPEIDEEGRVYEN